MIGMFIQVHAAQILNALGGKINIPKMIDKILTGDGESDPKAPTAEELKQEQLEFLRANYGDKAAPLIKVIEDNG